MLKKNRPKTPKQKRKVCFSTRKKRADCLKVKGKISKKDDALDFSRRSFNIKHTLASWRKGKSRMENNKRERENFFLRKTSLHSAAAVA